ncbi:unnamed protein product [Spirodela intermedia]|uniref:Thaumatin-like protein n=1 Tax=Spirodela intermedia TaxID=51605 RepID=A0ABN7E8B2_SPIIN|nr:unnamed protein product [Spirodela intermedia]
MGGGSAASTALVVLFLLLLTSDGLAGASPAPVPRRCHHGILPQHRRVQVPPAPAGWSGRFTLCAADPTSGKFSCGPPTAARARWSAPAAGPRRRPHWRSSPHRRRRQGLLRRESRRRVQPAVLVAPRGVSTGGAANNSCSATGCVVDLNGACPSELKVKASGEGVACRSACEAFGKPEYCCSGSFANPTCRPSSYSKFFKNACPRAYSYAYDDGTSTFTCPGGTSYLITFCPTTAR